MTTTHSQIAVSVLELMVLHNAIFEAHSNCFSANAVGCDDFADILLKDRKENNASPTDQNILDFTEICINACREKKFSGKCSHEADVLLASIEEFEKCLTAASPEVRDHFNRGLICDVRAAELLTEDPDVWRPPTSNEVRQIVGRSSKTGISGAKAARLIGVTDAAFRKYTAGEGATRRHTISYAAWHLLLHRLSIRRATIENVTPKITAQSTEQSMTATPNILRENNQPSKIPKICRPLFKALANSLLLFSSVPLSIAADLVQADPAAAKLLRDQLAIDPDNPIKVNGTIYDSGIRHLMLNDLRPMIVRTEGRRLLDEMENDDPAL